MSSVMELDTDTYKTHVTEAEGTVMVDFWAPWCGPCLMMGPVIDELAAELDGKVTVAKVNVDKSPEIAAQYGIRGIPTLLFFKNGELVDQEVGVQTKARLVEKLNALLN